MQLATFAPTPSVSVEIAETARRVVREHDESDPRTLQKALGPSEIGDDCAACLARKMMGEPVVNTRSDPWPSIVGRAVHSWLEGAFRAENERLGRVRFLTETKVQVRPGLTGHCDLYDADTAMIGDHKIVGETTMRQYKREGPSAQYRAQAHLYGVGARNLGLPVQRVAILFYPRGGMLSGLHVWSEPFDPAIADAALERHDAILEAACALRVDERPEHYAHIPASPGHRCTFCPYFSPGAEIGRACPGHMPG